MSRSVMGDLAVSHEMKFAARRAREQAAEKHFFDLAQPHYPGGYSIFQRNAHHWDVTAKQCPGKVSAWLAANPGSQTFDQDGVDERAFRIRGEPGNVIVMDERWNPHRPHPRESLTFRSIQAAMLWISEELMQEPALRDPADREGGR